MRKHGSRVGAIAVILAIFGLLPVPSGAATPGPGLPTACPDGQPPDSGTIATVAGTGVGVGPSGDDGDGGPALDARLNTSLGSIAVASGRVCVPRGHHEPRHPPCGT